MHVLGETANICLTGGVLTAIEASLSDMMAVHIMLSRFSILQCSKIDVKKSKAITPCFFVVTRLNPCSYLLGS